MHFKILSVCLIAFTSLNLCTANEIVASICTEFQDLRTKLQVENRFCRTGCYEDSKGHTVIMFNDCKPLKQPGEVRQQYYKGNAPMLVLKRARIYRLLSTFFQIVFVLLSGVNLMWRKSMHSI